MQDSFNENDGLLNAMGHMAAISQRNQQIAQQKEHAAAIRKQTAELEKANRIEADRAQIERQRLAIEQQRLEADELEREMRKQQAEQVRQLRNLMVDSMDTLESVKKSLVVQSVDEASKETALRKTADLQAQLKILESQSDILTDMSDMKELRSFRSSLSEFISEESADGNLPDNPLAIINARLESLEAFFAQSDVELKRLLGWKADWLNQFPRVSLAELHQAQTELSEIKNQLPSIQERLQGMLNPLDWNTVGGLPDLHQEMRICAELMLREEIEDRGESTGGIILPGSKKSYRPYLPDSGACRDKYEFSHSKGGAHDLVISHLNKIASRFNELVSLHEKHHKLLSEAVAHLAEENFRSAERVVKIYDKHRFPDIDYKKVDTLIQRQLTVWQKFNDLNIRINSKNYREISHNLRQVQGIDIKSGSELATEISELSQKIERIINAHHQARKKALMTKSIVIFLVVVAIGSFSAYVIQGEKKAQLVAAEAKAKAEQEVAEAKAKAEQEVAEAKAKAEQEVAEAKAKAEQEAAEAKAKAEQEAAEAKAKPSSEIGAGRVGATFGLPLEGKTVMPFAFCPAGSFTMGSPELEEDRSSNEKQVKVTLIKGFWMAKTELTQAQWTAIMGNNPSRFNGNDLPVEGVSWEDTQEFIKKVNDSGVIPEGWKLSLPSEAQWEYACRAGETGPFSGGTIDQVAWYGGNSGDKTHAVGTKKSNAWGLHDMHGNLWEWCSDLYDRVLSGGTDPSGPSSGVFRVLRGGSWDDFAAGCRAASRNWDVPDPRGNDVGFRPALVPSE